MSLKTPLASQHSRVLDRSLMPRPRSGRPVSYSWGDVNPDGSPEWDCPHCGAHLCTSRAHYYRHHFNGQCLVPRQGTDEQHQSPAEDPAGSCYVDDSGEQRTGAAAVFAREHDDALAQFQQLCLDAGLSHEQLLALQPGLQRLGDPFRQLLEHLHADADDTPEAEVEAELREQTEALHQRLEGRLCEGESQAGALEAWVRMFSWRCRHHIKVSCALHEAQPAAPHGIQLLSLDQHTNLWVPSPAGTAAELALEGHALLNDKQCVGIH